MFEGHLCFLLGCHMLQWSCSRLCFLALELCISTCAIQLHVFIADNCLFKISFELYLTHVLPSSFFIPCSQKSWLRGWPSPKSHTINTPPHKNPLKSAAAFWWNDQIWHFLVKKIFQAVSVCNHVWHTDVAVTDCPVDPARPKAESQEGKASCGAVSRHFTAASMSTFGGRHFPHCGGAPCG